MYFDNSNSPNGETSVWFFGASLGPTACMFEGFLFLVVNFLYSCQVRVPSSVSNLSNEHSQSGSTYYVPH